MISIAANAFEGFDQTTQKRSLIGRKGSMSSSSEISFPPYEVVPATRPIIVIGPSLRGYDVTDLMHRALYNFLKKRFSGKISVYRTHADIGLSKRSKNNSSEKERFNIAKTGGPRMTAEVQKEVERIYELTKTLKMVVIDCDVINHPSQLLDCSLAPISIYIKMEPQILEKLVKLRGSKRKNLGAQVVAAQKLAQCNEEMFDLILDEAIFEDACEHLGEFLDQYWRDLHPSDREDAVGPLTEKTPLLQGMSNVPAIKAPLSSSAMQNQQSTKQVSPLKNSPQHGEQNLLGAQQGNGSGSQRKMAVSGNAPDFGKKLHEAFQSSQPKPQGVSAYQAGYGSDVQQYDRQQQQQQQQQYYQYEDHYEQEQNYGSDLYGHQQSYQAEPYHQQGYSQQYGQDSQYGYGQYGQGPNQGYSHGYANENQYPDPYYNRDVSTGYNQQYGNDMEGAYQGQEWYGDAGDYYSRDGYYH